MSRLRVLVLTNLFPNHVDPGFAPFNRQQFAALEAYADVEVRAVLPWRFGRYYGAGKAKDVVAVERIEGLHVRHPRYPALPGLGGLNALLMAGALLPEAFLERSRFDVILASYAYPDGVAGVMLGQALGVPVVVKCHGSDMNRVPKDRLARAQLTRWLPRAAAVVVVSKKLGEVALELGVPAERVHVVYNGIDRARFFPSDRAEARRALELPVEAELVVYAGRLDVHKGTRELLAAAHLVHERRAARAKVATTPVFAFIGDGPLAREVREHAEHSAGPRIIAPGRVPHAEIPRWMAAADVFCLPSHDEGMPNVIREAHASGRPVVATDVGGVEEALGDPVLGRLVPPRDPPALAAAIAELLEGPRASAAEIAERAQVPSWRESAGELYRVLAAAAGRRAPEAAHAPTRP